MAVTSCKNTLADLKALHQVCKISFIFLPKTSGIPFFFIQNIFIKCIFLFFYLLSGINSINIFKQYIHGHAVSHNMGNIQEQIVSRLCHIDACMVKRLIFCIHIGT